MKTLLIGFAVLIGVVLAIGVLIYLFGLFGIFLHNKFSKEEKLSYKDSEDVMRFGIGNLFIMMGIVILCLIAYMLGMLFVN